MVSSTKIVKAALFNDKDEILLLTRSSTDTTRPSSPDLPGGSVEGKENLTQAVLREIEEETGLVVPESTIELAYTATICRDGENFLRFLFVGKLIGQQVIRLSHEHDGYSWLPLTAAFAQYDHPVWMEGLRYLTDNKLI